ncbi:uncharacterized protein CDV56_101260 [Aspergillus thermomutatus]|uniref:Uncharacterized protein n=1 Tax=Aspergillus thermomutatus TaxID=41047 RepID=A0A397GFS7_ASPTH|nr:uncharacterized protein CDV56_101260 [Aspergillus thermomutatus]RHZ49771.1 hypothetical protein CDV56_101260 [Aspergillus thermomutatus]
MKPTDNFRATAPADHTRGPDCGWYSVLPWFLTSGCLGLSKVEMEGSVVEGISTSLPTCPLFSQPYDPQSLFAPEDLPNPPSYHDLGLTPPPGSQLLQPTNVTQPHPLLDEHGSSDGDVRISMASQPAGSNYSDQARGSRKDTPDDPSQLRQESSSNIEVGPPFPSGQAASPVESTVVATNAASQTRLPEPLSSNTTRNADDLLYDPLFGTDFVMPNFDANPSPLKRTADEALADDFRLWHRPEKRRMLGSLQSSSAPSLNATPSLSSPDTIQLDQFETVPNTPGGIAESQLPAPPFDFFDPLFEDPAFHIPLDLSETEYSFENQPTPHSADAGSSYDASRRSSLNSCEDSGNVQVQAADPVTFDHQAECVPLPTSELTKRQFSLDPQDVLANADRETLQRVDYEPEYISPYPVYRGPLGYLPSAPGIHVKCIRIADDQINARLSHLKYKVHQLKYERDKYRNAWSKWTALEASTGKSREQILEGENATLRRVSTQHQKRAEQYKQEIEVWKGRLHDLSVLHNNLLYEIHVQKRMPAVAPVPRGYRPPTYPQPVAPGQQLASFPAVPVSQHPVPGPASSPSHVPVPTQPPVMPAFQGPSTPYPHLPHQNPAQKDPQPSGTTPGSVQHPTPAEPQPERVTIDLTDEAPGITPNLASIAPSEPSQETGELLQSLQKKRYNWLERAKSGSAQPAVARAGSRPPLRSESVPRASQQSPASRSSSNQRPSVPPPEIHPASDTNYDDQIDIEDELLREMEEELARG